MIELEDVVRTFGGRRVVDGVSLTVPTGAFCALVGSSGAGKSTTLKMINRLVPMSAGTIRIGGEDVARTPLQALRRRIGYVIQSIGLFPHWTVADNIATVPRLLGWPTQRIAARVDELLALLRLDPAEHRDRYPHQLSGGQQQRVGVARALAADPEHPADGRAVRRARSDHARRAGARARARSTARGKTIVFVTHDIDMALRARRHRRDHATMARSCRPARRSTSSNAPPTISCATSSAEPVSGSSFWRCGASPTACGPDVIVAGEPLAEPRPLTEALSQMVMRRTDRVPVRDAPAR